MQKLIQHASPRRSEYDYGSPGGYFITICTADRQHYFGEIEDGEMVLSEIGKVCEQEIIETDQRRNYVEIDEYIIMPNHIHLLLFINTIPAVGTCGNTSALETDAHCYLNQLTASDTLSSESDTLPYVPTGKQKPEQTLWSIVRNIKSRVQKYANEYDIIFWWQGRYHDHIIRDQFEYERIRYYIQTNPKNRLDDTFNK